MNIYPRSDGAVTVSLTQSQSSKLPDEFFAQGVQRVLSGYFSFHLSPLRREFSSVLNIDDDTSRGSPFALYLAEAWAVYAVFLSGSEELL